jgi:hypothetical protein
MNIVDHISESLKNFFELKYLNSLMQILMRIRDRGIFLPRIRDGKKFGSGINTGFADGSFEKLSPERRG